VRILAVVAGRVAGAAVFLTSFKGAQTREFLSEARFELRKVVWPTRQEAMRTTWVVIIAVILIALLLGVFDWFIKLGISALLGT
jgi:preprotein translocase subunit SecE